jgi:hypothetical protein
MLGTAENCKAAEDLDAVGERVSVQVRILDDHDRVLGRPGWARAG